MEEIIDLDECVISALELFSEEGIPQLELDEFERPLVVGSGNSAVTGKIIFEDTDAVFADEGTYERKLDAVSDIDGVILISASGGKHAPGIAEKAKEFGKKVVLVTCNEDAPAAEYADEVNVTPKQAEPYTYNTSTYMGMILSQTREEPDRILSFIKEEGEQQVPDNLESYESFCILLPPEFDNVRELFSTKFDELFGPTVNGRVFTSEQVKHAKTVVKSDSELFVSFGHENSSFGKNRLNIPLPGWAGPATVMAIGYYFIGKIQKAKPDWFKDSLAEYVKEASEEFGQEINQIVE